MRLQGLVVFSINPQGVHGGQATIEFYRQVVARLRRLPGVESVTLAENRPGSGWSNNDAAIVDGRNPAESGNRYALMRANSVAADFFHTMGIPILLGRDILESDTETSQKVAVINETFAERFLPGQNPLGHRIGSTTESLVIVGVAARNKYTGFREKDIPMMWTPYVQKEGGRGISEMNVEMRVESDPLAVLPAAAKVIREIDPNLPLSEPMTQKAQFESSILNQRLFSRLSIFFGALAGLLVATGLYGTLAYRASHRTVEIGVRLAVGARRGQVLWMLLRESLILAAIGVSVGLIVAVATARTLRTMLFGVAPYDLLTYFTAILVVSCVALLASLLPARRAANIDPMRALRAE
jgi:predicted permease